MSDVVDLQAVRAAKADALDEALADPTNCQACGNCWFEIIACLDPDYDVGGYKWPPICTECGTELERPE